MSDIIKVFPHDCNAYCNESEHAVVIYANPQHNNQYIEDELIKVYPIEVLSLDLAREAPSLETVADEYEDIHSGLDGRFYPDAQPWLLRYRTLVL